MRPEFREGWILRSILSGLVLWITGAGAGIEASAQSTSSTGQEGVEILGRIVALDLQDVSLPEALRRIRQSTGIGLVYSPDLLPPDRTVSCPCQEKTVDEALTLILQGTDLSFSATTTQVRIFPTPRRPAAPQQTGGPPVG